MAGLIAPKEIEISSKPENAS